ncbi:unnamed protein product, partial [Rotaria magnacalcarata]
LVIDINTNKIQSLPADNNTIIFTHIFTTFTNLQCFNFGPSLFGHQRLLFFTSPLTIIFTNLLKLHVHLENFNDCLYLLDETCVYDELILLLLHRMLNLEKLHLCPTVGEKEHYHIYSYPYKLNYYDDITNNLPGGILKYVRKLSLFNEHPFEHEFSL